MQEVQKEDDLLQVKQSEEHAWQMKLESG